MTGYRWLYALQLQPHPSVRPFVMEVRGGEGGSICRECAGGEGGLVLSQGQMSAGSA